MRRIVVPVAVFLAVCVRTTASATAQESAASALIRAVQRDDPAMVRKILSRSPQSVGERDSLDLGALHWAALRGDALILETLLDAGADIESAEGSHGRTPLHLASHRGHHEPRESDRSCSRRSDVGAASGISAISSSDQRGSTRPFPETP